MSSAIPIRDRRRLVITAAALFVATLEAAAILHQLRRPAVMMSVPAAVSALAPAPPALRHVDLSVERNGQSLRLRWDQGAAAVRDATHATLHIEDGNHQNQLDLDSTLLHSGVLSYWPETRNVEFRLELFTPVQTVTGSIRAVNGTLGETVEGAALTERRRHASSEDSAERSEADQTRPSPFAPPKSRKVARAVATAAARRAAASDIAAAPAAATAPETAAAPVTTAKEEPTAPALTPGRTALRDVVVPLPPAAADREATEVTEPQRSSRWSRIAGKIPLLRRLVKRPQATPEPGN